MDSNYKLHQCKVCGLHLGVDTFPWGEDGKTPSFEICECCGVEFGYEDACSSSAKAFREEWLSKGAKWNEEKEKPLDWSLEEQLKSLEFS
ncbi:MAG: hypothetical protein L7U87_00090 [Chlamydiales bacterium]|nr:hypothetical protein [Chlamydiales bacterium]